MKKGINLIYEELTYKIRGILYNIHNKMNKYYKEIQYGDEIEKELKANNIRYKREFKISNTRNIPDFIIEDKLILEIKAKNFITKDDYFQVQRYLQDSNLKLALLVNFRSKYLNPKRIIRIDRSVLSA